MSKAFTSVYLQPSMRNEIFSLIYRTIKATEFDCFVDRQNRPVNNAIEQMLALWKTAVAAVTHCSLAVAGWHGF